MKDSAMSDNEKRTIQLTISRRSILQSALTGIAGISFYNSVNPKAASAQQDWPGTMESRERFFSSFMRRIRILPGSWRPHFPFEHIAWVKPPWESHDYIWMDFPEAIFCNQGLLYLSHISPRFPQVFPNEPRIPWKEITNGILFERTLPNKITFGGSLVKASEVTVDLKLYIRNGTKQPLTDIKLQTCAFLRHSKEFSEFTAENKYVHLPEHGWLPFPKAQQLQEEKGKYRLGWRSGPKSADLPVMVTKARPEHQGMPETKRMAALTWEEHTYSLISNPQHPCMHADPFFGDLEPGQSATINGRLIFFEGEIEDFRRVFFG